MEDNNYHIIAFHGWGFDDSLWDLVRSELEPAVRFDAVDRGYFSDASEPGEKRAFENQTQNILVAHSYGLHWCSEDLLKEADHLVLISSFLHFHPRSEQEYRKSKLILRKMLAQFVDAPEKVLGDFYENAFYPEDSQWEVPGNLNHDRLLSDLSDLDRDHRKNADVFDMNSITIIHGTEDKIVSNELAREMYAKLRLRSRYFEIVDGGHALPVTHASKISEILKSLFQIKQYTDQD